MMTSESPPLLKDIARLEDGCSIDSFEILQSLGQGSMGNVRLVIHRRTRMPMAMKTILRRNMDEERIVAELLLHREMKHTNVLRLKGFFSDGDSVHLLLQLARGSVHELLQKLGRLTNEKAARVIGQTSMGLDYLHSQGIIHRDVKPDNLLLDINQTILVADFGWSAYAGPGESRTTIAGTPLYMAPEQTALMNYDYAVDIWSLGIVAYELVCGITPFEGSSSYRQLGENIRNGCYVLPSDIPASASRFIKGLLQVNPASRTRMEDILKAEWIVEHVGDGRTAQTENLKGGKSETDPKGTQGKAVGNSKEEKSTGENVALRIQMAAVNGDKAVCVTVTSVKQMLEIVESELRIQEEDIHHVTLNSPKTGIKKSFKGLCREGDTFVFHRNGPIREIVLTKKQQKKERHGPIFDLQYNGLGRYLIEKVDKSQVKGKDLPVPGEAITEMDGISIKGWSYRQLHEAFERIPYGNNFKLSLVSSEHLKAQATLKSLKGTKENCGFTFQADGTILRWQRLPLKVHEKLTKLMDKYYGLTNHSMAAELLADLSKCIRLEDARKVIAAKELPEVGDEMTKALWKAALKSG